MIICTINKMTISSKSEVKSLYGPKGQFSWYCFIVLMALRKSGGSFHSKRHDFIGPRTVSSWVTSKLCRCFARYTPCRNQLLSISGQIAFCPCFRVCWMPFFFIPVPPENFEFAGGLDFMISFPLLRKQPSWLVLLLQRYYCWIPSRQDATQLHWLRCRVQKKKAWDRFPWLSQKYVFFYPHHDNKPDLNKAMRISVSTQIYLVWLNTFVRVCFCVLSN